MFRDGKVTEFFVHTLVARAFIGPCPIGKEVNHIDLDKQNNAATNLEYLTRKENIHHSIRIAGDQGNPRKLTIEQVNEIREGAKTTQHWVLAQQFGVSRQTIGKIVNNQRYTVWRNDA